MRRFLELRPTATWEDRDYDEIIAEVLAEELALLAEELITVFLVGEEETDAREIDILDEAWARQNEESV